MAQDYTSWAILNSKGLPICDYVGITACNVSQSATVLTEPLENGELAAFNKVQQPDAVRVSIGIDGDPSVQSAALNSLLQLKQAVGVDSLCQLITPFFVIDRLALEEISQARSVTQNASSLICELSFLKVRMVSTGARQVLWTPKNPTSANNVNGGKVQAETTLVKGINAAFDFGDDK